MVTENPLISVIVAAYNIEPYIGDCLESILKQTYSNLEIIIINDGSEDQTESICKTYAQKDNRLKLYTTKNGGLSHARNFGVRHSTGQYLIFVDGDDMLDCRAIQKLYETASRHHSDIVICNFSIINAKQKLSTWHSKEISHKKAAFYNPEEYFSEILNFNKRTYAWGTLLHRNLLSSLHFPEGRYYEDLATMYKILQHAHKISYLNEALVGYRQLETSISHNINDMKIKDFLDFSQQMCNYIAATYPNLEAQCKRYKCCAFISALSMEINKQEKAFRIQPKPYRDKINEYIGGASIRGVSLKIAIKLLIFKISYNFGFVLFIIKKRFGK